MIYSQLLKKYDKILKKNLSILIKIKNIFKDLFMNHYSLKFFYSDIESTRFIQYFKAVYMIKLGQFIQKNEKSPRQ